MIESDSDGIVERSAGHGIGVSGKFLNKPYNPTTIKTTITDNCHRVCTDNDILSTNALAPSIRFTDVAAAAASPFPRETTPQEQQACDDLLYLFLTITSNKLYIFIRFRKWKKEKNFVSGKCPSCMRPTGIC
ncbi:hypothetical protein QTP88_020696 [Uroleucon formosanum]